MTAIAEDAPHFRAHCRDGSVWTLALSGYEDFCATWMAGKAFWRGQSATPCAVIVKLADITGVSLWTQEKIDYEREAVAESKRRAMVEG